LFATQAILPALTRAYGTTPAMMSFAVNASTIGMAVSGLATALIARRIDRRRGIMLSLALLSLPTLALASRLYYQLVWPPRHGRPCAGHPRLFSLVSTKTRMVGQAPP
jgi:MFS family permease